MEKVKALVRHLVLVVLLDAQGASACRAFVLALLREIPEESLE